MISEGWVHDFDFYVYPGDISIGGLIWKFDEGDGIVEDSRSVFEDTIINNTSLE